MDSQRVFEEAKSSIINHFEKVAEYLRDVHGDRSTEASMFYSLGSDTNFLDSLRKGSVPYTKVEEDESLDFSRVIMCIDALNMDNFITQIPEFSKHVPKFHTQKYAIGLADSISQIIKEYGKHLLILVEPVEYHPDIELDGDNPDYGIRLNSYPEYIGIHQDKFLDHEYMGESGIKFLWEYMVFPEGGVSQS